MRKRFSKARMPSPAMGVGLLALFVALGGAAYAVDSKSEGGLVRSPAVKNILFEHSEDNVMQPLAKVGGVKLSGRCEDYNTTGTRFQIYAKAERAVPGELFSLQNTDNGSAVIANTNGINLQPGVRVGVAILEASAGTFRRKLFSIVLRRGKQVINVEMQGYVTTNGSSCEAYGTATAGTR